MVLSRISSSPQTPRSPIPYPTPPNKVQTPPHKGDPPEPPMVAAPQTLSSLCTAVYCGQGALLGWGRGAAAKGGPRPRQRPGVPSPAPAPAAGGAQSPRGGGGRGRGSRRVPARPSMARHTAHGARRMAHGRRSAGSGRGAAGGHRRSCGGRGGRGAGARCPVPANWCPEGRWASGARCRWGARAPRRSRRVAALGTRNEMSALDTVAPGTAGREGAG